MYKPWLVEYPAVVPVPIRDAVILDDGVRPAVSRQVGAIRLRSPQVKPARGERPGVHRSRPLAKTDIGKILRRELCDSGGSAASPAALPPVASA